MTKAKARLSITFLVGAFAFLISGSVLQRFVENRPLKIVLNVTPWTDDFGAKYGQLYVRQGIKRKLLIENAVSEDNQQK